MREKKYKVGMDRRVRSNLLSIYIYTFFLSSRDWKKSFID